MKRFIAIVPVCVVAAIAGTGPSIAETMKITVVAAAPPQVTNVKVTKEKFIPEVNKRLAASGKDFKVEWTEAYSQTLAKFNEVFETVEDGIAQMGVDSEELRRIAPAPRAVHVHGAVHAPRPGSRWR